MGKKITFADLVSKIAEESGTSKKLIRDLLKETVNITKEGLVRDGRVHLSGLGYFNLKWTLARRRKHPRTGETFQVPAQNRVKFKAEAALRNYINRQYEQIKPKIKEQKGPASDIAPDFSTVPVRQFESVTDLNDVPSTLPQTEERKSKKLPAWTWLISLLIAIALIAIYWPFKEIQPPVVTDTNIAENVVSEFESETQKLQLPVAKPAALGFQTTGADHRIKAGDTLWYLALQYYNEAYFWPNIFRVNLTKIKNPDALLAGIYIKVPPLEGKVGSLNDKDIDDIAEGYIQVYLVYKKLGKNSAFKYLWVAQKCNVPEVINQFINEIDKADLKLVSNIEGFSRIK